MITETNKSFQLILLQRRLYAETTLSGILFQILVVVPPRFGCRHSVI